MSMPDITVAPVASRRELRDFIELPYRLHRFDPHWVPPLKMERKEFFDPRKNPFFENAEVAFFVARSNGKTVGRISAQINRLHNEQHGEKTAHFGSFEAENDSAVSRALFAEAEAWARARRMDRMTGPFTLSINEETGLLVEGYDSPPFPFMAHNPSYYPALVEANGYAKVKDLIAWRYDITRPVPETASAIADAVRQYPGLVVRGIDMKHIKRELGIVSDVFNSAWAKNWGFIPWTDSELKKMAKDMKLILYPELALIAEVEGKPAAIAFCLPNINEAIRDLGGRLFPFGLFKMLWRLKVRRVKSSRLCLFGIKKEYRQDVLAGLSVMLYVEMHRRTKLLGLTNGELSWTLEDNDKINKGITLMGGVPYKKYRVFSKTLDA